MMIIGENLGEEQTVYASAVVGQPNLFYNFATYLAFHAKQFGIKE